MAVSAGQTLCIPGWQQSTQPLSLGLALLCTFLASLTFWALPWGFEFTTHLQILSTQELPAGILSHTA